jgi:hypothetical protein
MDLFRRPASAPFLAHPGSGAGLQRMWTKRLEMGSFPPAFSADDRLGRAAIEAAELALVGEGIDLAGAPRRRRWEPGREA